MNPYGAVHLRSVTSGPIIYENIIDLPYKFEHFAVTIEVEIGNWGMDVGRTKILDISIPFLSFF